MAIKKRVRAVPRTPNATPGARRFDAYTDPMSPANKELAALFARAARQGQLQEPGLRYDVARLDSDSINLVIDFRTRLQTVYRDKFQALRALDFVPMLDAPVQQTSTGYIGEFLSRVGEAKLITEVSTDIPLVNVVGRTFTGSVATYGAAGAWNQLDVFRAAVGVVQIPVETQRAARLAIETKTDELVSLGSTDANIPGFLRHPDVDVVPLGLGNWATRSFDAMLGDFHAWIGSLQARVGYVETSVPDTVLFAPRIRTVLNGIRNSINSMTAWSAMVKEAREEYGITVDTWSRLNAAGVGGVARAVAYRRDPAVLGALVPMVYTEFAAQERGFQILLPAMARCGGTVVIEPKAVSYTDNTLS